MKTIGYFVPFFPTLSETFILREYLMLRRQGVPLAAAAYQPAVEAQVQPEAAEVARDFSYLRHQPPARTALRAAWQRLARPQALNGLPPDRIGEAADLAAAWRACGVAHAHIHFGNDAADVPLAAARLLGITASLSLHAQDIYLTSDDDLRRRIAACAFAVTCTAFNRTELLRRTGLDGERIRLLYHGVEVPGDMPGVAEPERMVLAVGRLVHSKGFDLLLRALPALPGLTAVIVGDGPERAALAGLARELAVAERVHFPGALPFAALRPLFARALAVCVPSRVLADGDSDGIPNVLIEAMAHGAPVVAAAVRSIAEIVRDGDNGLLVPPDDPDALARALAGLSADPARRAAIAVGGARTRREQFDLAANVERLRHWLAGTG